MVYIAYWKDDSVSAYASDTDRETAVRETAERKGENWLEGWEEFTLEEIEDYLFEKKAAQDAGLLS
jgi:hypothetical protein